MNLMAIEDSHLARVNSELTRWNVNPTPVMNKKMQLNNLDMTIGEIFAITFVMGVIVYAVIVAVKK